MNILSLYIERWSLYKGLKYIAEIILGHVQVVIIERWSYYRVVIIERWSYYRVAIIERWSYYRVVIIERWSYYRVAIIERWSYYRVVSSDKFHCKSVTTLIHCNYMYCNVQMYMSCDTHTSHMTCDTHMSHMTYMSLTQYM